MFMIYYENLLCTSEDKKKKKASEVSGTCLADADGVV